MTVTTTQWSYHDTAASYALAMLIFLTSIGFSSFSQADEMLHWRTLWVRSMPPGATVSAAYGELMNHGDKTVTVASVSSDVSDSAEMHEVIAEGDQRRMAQLTSIDIAPHQTLVAISCCSTSLHRLPRVAKWKSALSALLALGRARWGR